MTNIDLKNLTIAKAHKHLVDGDFSAVELTEAFLNSAKEKNEEINAYVEIFDDAIEMARSADERIKNGEATLLTGIPFAIKDNILIKGKEATASSKILKGYIAPYDATAIENLKKAGAVFIGRTNMDEFAMGSSTESSCYGITRNPRDTTRVPGGSSGGSAAAVAMDGALIALGSDTGGSIRQPASFCGVVGLKPTYGAISRYGLMAMGSSLDQIGPFSKTVEDAEIVFDAISGFDKMDGTSNTKEMTEIESAKLPKEVKKIGVPKDFLNGDGIDKEVLSNFNESIEKLKASGYEIKEIDLPNTRYALAVYYILMPAEVSSNLARFDGIRFGLSSDGGNMISSYSKTRGEGFGKEVRRRIMLGTYVLSAGYYDAYYNKANIVRNMITEDFKKAFEQVDVVATPTSPVPAFKLGEKSDNPLEMYLADIYTVPTNLAGVPAISVPSGETKEKLPLGIQFTAPHFGEKLLFDIGKKFEQLR